METSKDNGTNECVVSVVWSATHHKNGATPLRVECAQGRGFSGIVMIGSAGQVCEDGKERARTALERLGWEAPPRRILISVSPGEAKIDNSHLDLALCVGLAGVSGQTDWVIRVDEWMFTAEVGLNGELRPVSGVVAWASVAMSHGLKGIVVARENLKELHCLSQVEGLTDNKFKYLGFETLDEVITWVQTGKASELNAEVSVFGGSDAPDFDDMDLSATMRLVAMVAATGMHSVLLRGSPGTGKSMFARRLPSILPLMNPDEHLNALRVHSASSSRVAASILAGVPPYRSPHHFTSLAAMVGTATAPGEMSLASGGVLFLDELPEFRRDVLEGLREPMESGEVAVSRAGCSNTWTSRVLMISAANNCPCGWGASKRRRCVCPPSRVQAYRSRLSGPLQDRIDMQINMEEPTDQVASIFGAATSQDSQTASMREVVARARDLAKSRFKTTGVLLNRDVSSRDILGTFGVDVTEALIWIERITPRHASARSLIRCLRVARSIADVAGRTQVESEDVECAWSWQAWSAARQRGDVLPI